MGKKKTKVELDNHKEKALKKIETYLDSLINSDDKNSNSKADKLSYWLEDWSRFLDFETKFSPLSLRRYKRGEIIKVHLGFNIGSEEGGLHYAVVLDKQNAKSSKVITIVPLASVKPMTNLSNLKSGSVFLGNELYINLSIKSKTLKKNLSEKLDLLAESLSSTVSDNAKHNELLIQIKSAIKEKELVDRISSEISKMKQGSIALVNQITTISKIRIYDPKTDKDILSGIRLSNENLDKIDTELKKSFIK